MSFRPCSKNLAENRFWSLMGRGSGVSILRPSSPTVCCLARQARTALGREITQADVIWSPREGWAAPARFRTVQAGRKDLPFSAQRLRAPWRGKLCVRQETARVHHAARRRGDVAAHGAGTAGRPAPDNRIRSEIVLGLVSDPQSRLWRGHQRAAR
jgi:hypothetical protein